VGVFARIMAAQGAKRQRTNNAQCRIEELRMIMRRGDPAERQIYMAASSAWDEAGQPDVPLITQWYARSQGLTD
jgi:hypothetical protein